MSQTDLVQLTLTLIEEKFSAKFTRIKSNPVHLITTT